jgi:predicted secreted Zn-dependent protease
MVPFGFGDLRQTRPAHVQGNREKAADGIRTHDLLHGKQTL